jgi:hypothetical protein
MISDASFRDLMMGQRYHTFLDSLGKASFTAAQEQAIKDLVRYINEIARMILKEEGILVSKL